ncbi:MAG: YfiR family protein, partial [Gammaproteobacteria bacterium]|nr:YfiR family protein [Gammaproteobacteria bacterium]
NFAKFTSWPEHIWKENNASLNLCITGKDGLVSKLEQLTGKVIQEHPVIVQLVKNPQNMKQCHLLYIATSEKNHYQTILKSVQNEPVLTVSELPQFGRSGGIIELYREKEKTRFIINLDTARESGLTISSRLLNLARIINNETAP